MSSNQTAPVPTNQGSGITRTGSNQVATNAANATKQKIRAMLDGING
jgi:hypothetical protein